MIKQTGTQIPVRLEQRGELVVLHVQLPDGKRVINITGLQGAIVTLTSKEELVENLQSFHEVGGLEVFPEGDVLLLILPLPLQNI